MKVGLFIGRFCPVHFGHIETFKQMLTENDYIIIAIGSHESAFSPNKMLTTQETIQLIQSTLPVESHNVSFIELYDHVYNDLAWVTQVRSKVYNKLKELNIQSKVINLYGYNKDFTSKYLNWFPHYKLVENKPFVINNENIFVVDNFKKVDNYIISATDIRNYIFEVIETIYLQQECYVVQNIQKTSYLFHLQKYFEIFMPPKTFKLLLDIIFNNKERFNNLKDEYFTYKKYKEAWKNAPYPPVFVTGDAVVFCNGHVLVINRKFNPGKSLMALPGGFINQNETVKDCILRELKEETKINVPPNKLSNSIKAVEVFDTPNRSLRGRTITHAGVIILRDEQSLPRVIASDDALNASWLPIELLDSKRAMFFEDHYHIIKNLLKYYQEV